MPEQVPAGHLRFAGRNDARAVRGIAVQQVAQADGVTAAA